MIRRRAILPKENYQMSASNKHECTIVLDTNVFIRGNRKLTEARWKNLIEYISKTNASLLIPRVVWDEVEANFLKSIKAEFASASGAINKFNSAVDFYIDRHPIYHRGQGIASENLQAINLNGITKCYMAYIKDRLSLSGSNILDIEDRHFRSIYAKSISHKKPFSGDGDKGFKDAVLWQTILSLSDRAGFRNAPIVFISGNAKDFSDPSNSHLLHADLNFEAINKKLDVRLFDGLDAFIEAWAYDSLGINFKSIKGRVPNSLIIESLEPHVKSIFKAKDEPLGKIHVEGMSLSLKDSNPEHQIFDIAISGYFSREDTPVTGLEFSAEGTLTVSNEGVDLKITAINSMPEINTN